MAVIDSAYQYYLSTYGNSNVSRYDTHKKSQLRDVYNRIVKSNKEAPLYKIKDTGDFKKYAIDIKESTRNIQNVIASLSENGNGINSDFSKKVAQSSDEDIVSVTYIGSDTRTEEPVGFDIQVKQLASPQTNLGNYLTPNHLDFEHGTYSFDLITSTSSYEFQFSINPLDTNSDLQHKLMKLINNSGIGLNASLDTNTFGQHALKITSKQTGIRDEQDYLFQILPGTDVGSIHTMDVLGINHISEEAHNSSFILNDNEFASFSNTFTVNNEFDITLHAVNTDDDFTKIDFKASSDAIADNIELLIGAYNSLIAVGHNHEGSENSSKLVREISGIAKDYRNELEAIGLNITSEGYIEIDRNLLTDAISAEDADANFAVLNEFKDSLHDKTVDTAINPMNYVNKVIVTYKNPGKNFATPYITSIYAGMMLDRYC